MKIAIVVQGRFHAFDLIRALLKRGHDVTVFTNYPRWAGARFGLPEKQIRSFVAHGLITRIGDRIQALTGWSFESWTHRMFGRWAHRQLRRESWDVIHAWSGVAEEIYEDPIFAHALKLVMRGSAHIRSQANILAQEQQRVGYPVDRPSAWRIKREEREYALADLIVVLSTFALKSFVDEGVPESKLRFLPLGTDANAFRPAPEAVEARCARIVQGRPLRVLYVGILTFRKGLADLVKIVEQAAGRFEFRCVGAVTSEATAIVAALSDKVEFTGKKPQRELPQQYSWADVFVFPTIEDGFAVVLAQASAAALPVLTTANCCGPDLIHENRTGWLLPIRNSEAFLDRLNWCDQHRAELADMVAISYREFQPRDWSQVAADFETICQKELDEAMARKSAVLNQN